jgi:serine/threonine protein kinase/tetratricopeptide (TPR) repeat protein
MMGGGGMSDLTGKRFGQYEIVSLLGQGGMASVYRARQLNIERHVAIKVIKADLVEKTELLARFDREAQTIASLSHPHIVKLFDYGHQDGIVYFVMELMAGGSLAEYLTKGVPPLDSVDRLLDQIGSALSYAHQQGIIHRDLKPHNVLLDKNGNAILTDFGIAHLLTANTMITQNGETIGTPAYMSPEQWQSRPLDARADIYSLGVILFEMLSGQHPFGGDTPFQIMHKHLYEPLPSLRAMRPELPSSLERVLNTALAKQPKDRFESVDALVKAYEQARGDSGEAVSGQFAPIELLTLVGSEKPDVPADTSTVQGDHTNVLSSKTEPNARTNAYQRVSVGRRWLVVGGVVTTVLAVVLILLLVRGGNSNAPSSNTLNSVFTPVPPVAAGEYMILVAQMEQLDSNSPDVTRFIVNNLKQSFEVSVPFSNLRVRTVSYVIHSAEEALAAAKAARAAIVIWGNTSGSTTDLQVQVGDTALFAYNPCPEDLLRRTSDVGLRLTDPRSQSASISTLFTLVMAQACAGNGFEIMRLYSILDALRGTTPGELAGVGVAIQLHKALAFYQTDTKRVIDAISAIIDGDPGNPILYVTRSATYQRLGQYALARQDYETAARLGNTAWEGSTWASPIYLRAFESLITQDYRNSITAFDTLVQMRPDDWFAYSIRGANYYMLGDFDHAAVDLKYAVELDAPVNFPYMLGAVIALRQGRISEARNLVNEVIRKFPDPALVMRIMRSFYGDSAASFVFGPLLSGGMNAFLGQYDRAISDADKGIAMLPSNPELYLIQGFSYCNLNKPADAETAYTKGIEADPTLGILYLLRSEARRTQGDVIGMTTDLQAVATLKLGTEFDQLVQDGINFKVNCQNFFTQSFSATTPTSTVTP